MRPPRTEAPPSPASTVSLYEASRPTTGYTLVQSATSTPDGDFAFAVSPTTHSRYFARAGDGEGAGAALLQVRRAVLLDPVVVDGDRVTLTGRLLPAVVAPVDVVFTRDGVRTVEARGRADLRSGVRATFTSDRRGAFGVSVTVPGSADNLAGESAAQQVVVRPAATGSAPG